MSDEIIDDRIDIVELLLRSINMAILLFSYICTKYLIKYLLQDVSVNLIVNYVSDSGIANLIDYSLSFRYTSNYPVKVNQM